MSDAPLADGLLADRAEESDFGADAPRSVEDIRNRLVRATDPTECLCRCGDHENALHDLAASDVPVLLAAYGDAVDQLAKAHNTLDRVAALAGSWATEAYVRGESWDRRRWLDVAALIERGEV